MARQVANVDVQIDTFGSWIARTNELLEAFSNEVLTANSTSGVTGTPTSNRNSTLYGRFNTNTFYSSASFQVGDGIYANTTSFTFGPNIKIVANNRIGTTGQILAIGTTGLYWTDAGLGTVTRVQGGNGLNGDVTTAGVLSVRAGTGIIVDASGVSVDPSYISSSGSTNALTLLTQTWASPARIGSSIANTGTFTTATAASYSITGDPTFTLSGTAFRTAGYIESFTPATGTIGGINLRAASGGNARFRVTDYLGSTTYGTSTIASSGLWSWSGAFSAGGALSGTSASLTGNLTVSSGNVSGGGIVIADDGDIVDLNDGFSSHRFTNGVKVYSGNKSGTNAITLASNGTINAKELLIPSDSYVKLSQFTTGTGVGAGSVPGSTGNWVRLPNGMLLQWGSMPSQQDQYATVYFPQTFSTVNVAVTVSGGVKDGNNDAKENPTTVIAVGTSYFQTYTTENVSTTAWWIAMGF
jgi:hypothetical protein